jgi:hypothetical protein
MLQKLIKMVGFALIFDLSTYLGMEKDWVSKKIQKTHLQKYCLTGLKCCIWPSVTWVRGEHRFGFQNLLPDNHGVNVVKSFIWSKVITRSCSTHVMQAAFIHRVSSWSSLVTVDHSWHCAAKMN